MCAESDMGLLFAKRKKEKKRKQHWVLMTGKMDGFKNKNKIQTENLHRHCHQRFFWFNNLTKFMSAFK